MSKVSDMKKSAQAAPTLTEARLRLFTRVYEHDPDAPELAGYVEAIEQAAVRAALEGAVERVEALPQGKRTRRPRYSDEEGNMRTDYSAPAVVVPDGRVSLAAAIAAIREGIEYGG